MSTKPSRDDDEKSVTQAELAEKAMELKTAAAAEPSHPVDTPDGRRTGSGGMNPVPRPGYPPSGALDAEGHKPVLERSRKVR